MGAWDIKRCVRRTASVERYADQWQFGPDKPHPYSRANSALIMAAEPFLDFFRTDYSQPDG
ncbi:hypothetical protein ACFQ7J_02215 [Streptomyces sp. NPDC056501]|uniref:hypothetical protein n=1 Tax=Streptomyces sp. NPDC056501 TaxID=3345841 RepID=UPI0036A36099